MLYYTPVHITPPPVTISHHDSVFLIGSCFTTHIAEKLKGNLFNVLANPFGVLYNPSSIEQSIAIIKNKRTIHASDFFVEDGIYKSFLFHSKLADTHLDSLIVNTNQTISEAHVFFKKSNWFFITLGTAYVYELKDSGETVANCHKQNPNIFNHRLLSVEEVTNKLKNSYHQILELSPEANIVFTVSPVRHLKLGAHLNQVSKSTLLIAIHTIINECKRALYFPSYEIFMDELRDYRYYASDMLHPSDIGIEHVWNRFSQLFFDKQTQELNNQITEIKTALRHRPLFPESESFSVFKKQLEQKINRLKEKAPFLNIENI